jgi:hypothetical protein
MSPLAAESGVPSSSPTAVLLEAHAAWEGISLYEGKMKQVRPEHSEAQAAPLSKFIATVRHEWRSVGTNG